MFGTFPYALRLLTIEALLRQIALSSDEGVFGGWENVSKKFGVTYTPSEGVYDGRPFSFLTYVPSRTVAVYAPADGCDAGADELPFGIPGLGVTPRGPNFAP